MNKKFLIPLILLTILSLVMEIATRADSTGDRWWNAIPGYYLAIGFVGCIGIILISKALGKWWLQRKEDYYDAE